jgi:hypothetical protein
MGEASEKTETRGEREVGWEERERDPIGEGEHHGIGVGVVVEEGAGIKGKAGNEGWGWEGGR